ncbi:MAG TPA: nitrile hydratase subunit alpha [Rhodospirillaceae bacterium]|nr:nitrile hydratase subunit alpha [Rhodospirillaceae bacterium]|tara:strand:- start:277 stop:891 length:615 start_codon:yes stop_codon:yes gene_type:complete
MKTTESDLADLTRCGGRTDLLAQAVRNLLIDKGLINRDRLADLRAEIDTRGPLLGARLAARAWADADFRTLLLTDAKQAVFDELGLRITQGPEFTVVENTPQVHHAIVCTLCSCYPKAILGLPPDWYKSFAYRSRMVVEPRAIMEKFGTTIPDGTEIRVMDSTADLRYMVLPLRPPGTEGLGADDLARVISRDDLIGVTVPRAP